MFQLVFSKENSLFFLEVHKKIVLLWSPFLLFVSHSRQAVYCALCLCWGYLEVFYLYNDSGKLCCEFSSSKSYPISQVQKLQCVWEGFSTLTLKLLQITQDKDQSNNKNITYLNSSIYKTLLLGSDKCAEVRGAQQ